MVMSEGDLKEPTKAELKQEIASIDKAIVDMFFYGGNQKILINGDEVLRTRGRSKGLAIYADLERDAHAGAVIDKRKRAVTERDWNVLPASELADDVTFAQVCEEALERLRFDKMTKAFLDATLKGYSVVELIWDRMTIDGKEYVMPVKYKKRDQNRFVFDSFSRLRLLTKANMVAGEELPDRKFIVHTVGEADDSPYGRGIGNKLFWPVFFKRQGISFWLIFCDKFGSPTPHGKYPKGSTPTEQNDLLSTLRGISQDGALITPEGFEVELLEAARSGGADTYERMCAYMDAQISIATLGETLTTTVGNSGGNRALGEVHDRGRIELAKDDADDLSYTLNETLLKWMTELNRPGQKPPTVWREFAESEDLKTVSERDKNLKELGYERTPESFQETYGEGYTRVQQPTPDVNVSDGAAKTRAAADDSAAAFSEAEQTLFTRFKHWLGFAEPDAVERQRSRKRSDQDAIAQGAEAMAANHWELMLGPRVKQLQTVLDETGDLALFSERLQEMIDAEPDPVVVDALARASFSSRLAGRSSRGK
jgi:phage gp29-like protein